MTIKIKKNNTGEEFEANLYSNVSEGYFLYIMEVNDHIFKIKENKEEELIGIITHRLLIFICCKIIENTKNLIFANDFTCKCKGYTNYKKMEITNNYFSIISEWLEGSSIDVNKCFEIIEEISKTKDSNYGILGNFEHMWFAIELCLKYILFYEEKNNFKNNKFSYEDTVFSLATNIIMSRGLETYDVAEELSIFEIVYRLLLNENLLFWL